MPLFKSEIIFDIYLFCKTSFCLLELIIADQYEMADNAYKTRNYDDCFILI